MEAMASGAGGVFPKVLQCWELRWTAQSAADVAASVAVNVAAGLTADVSADMAAGKQSSLAVGKLQSIHGGSSLPGNRFGILEKKIVVVFFFFFALVKKECMIMPMMIKW